MGSKLLPAGTIAGAQNAPLYGACLLNLVEETPAAVTGAIGGDTSMGLNMGFLTDLPTFTVDRETVNITDPIIGLNTRIKGSEQLQSENATVGLSFANFNIDILQRALPGTVKSAWTGATTAFLTVGTLNQSMRVRARTPGTAGNSILYVQSAPSGTGAPFATVTVSGTAPAYTITVASKTDSTVNDVVAAINAHATAKTIVQAGLPAGTTGTGVPVTVTSTALAGGTAGSRIGYQLVSNGFWTLSEYINTVHVAWESTATSVAMLGRIKNAINIGGFEFQADDGGAMSGVPVTFTASSDEADYNATIGNYAGPYALLKLDDIP